MIKTNQEPSFSHTWKINHVSMRPTLQYQFFIQQIDFIIKLKIKNNNSILFNIFLKNIKEPIQIDIKFMPINPKLEKENSSSNVTQSLSDSQSISVSRIFSPQVTSTSIYCPFEDKFFFSKFIEKDQLLIHFNFTLHPKKKSEENISQEQFKTSNTQSEISCGSSINNISQESTTTNNDKMKYDEASHDESKTLNKDEKNTPQLQNQIQQRSTFESVNVQHIHFPERRNHDSPAISSISPLTKYQSSLPHLTSHHYNGLQNQGATCYMNSFLQSLFHTIPFRRAIFSFPIKNGSIVCALQKIFTALQIGHSAVSTMDLTNSFGWTKHEIFQQHDVQEFSRLFLDALDKEFKKAEKPDILKNLFQGKTRTFIRCLNVPFSSSREEEFYDISVDVKNCPTLFDSFKKYEERDKLVGDNKYETEKYGLQDAEMGLEFISFPPILHIHLRRFEYSPTSGNLVKINSKLVFPLVFNVDQYIAKNNDKTSNQNEKTNHEGSTKYELFGVLVHAGDASFGHYYTYLRPTVDQIWYKFNDSAVTHVSIEEMQNDSYGGINENGFIKRHSAYLLIYVQQDKIKEFYRPLKDDEIPMSLIKEFNERLKSQHLNSYLINKSKERTNMISKEEMSITYIITPNILKAYAQIGQFVFNFPNKNCMKTNLKLPHELYQYIGKKMDTDWQFLRLWTVSSNQGFDFVIQDVLNPNFNQENKSSIVLVEKTKKPCSYLIDQKLLLVYIYNKNFGMNFFKPMLLGENEPFSQIASRVAFSLCIEQNLLSMFILCKNSLSPILPKSTQASIAYNGSTLIIGLPNINSLKIDFCLKNRYFLDNFFLSHREIWPNSPEKWYKILKSQIPVQLQYAGRIINLRILNGVQNHDISKFINDACEIPKGNQIYLMRINDEIGIIPEIMFGKKNDNLVFEAGYGPIMEYEEPRFLRVILKEEKRRIWRIFRTESIRIEDVFLEMKIDHKPKYEIKGYDRNKRYVQTFVDRNEIISDDIAILIFIC